MATVGQGPPGGEGQNASIPFGDVSRFAQLKREVESTAGAAGPQFKPQQPTGQQQPPQGPPGAPPGDVAQPPADLPGSQRLDMNAVFPPMPEVNHPPPWREQLRVFAAQPGAAAHQRLADLIDRQHGPLK